MTGDRKSTWENDYNESFNGKFRKEFLDMEAFTTLKEAQVLTEQWRHVYNHIRPHISLGYKPPAPLAHALPDNARRTIGDFLDDTRKRGFDKAWKNAKDWEHMRMSPSAPSI